MLSSSIHAIERPKRQPFDPDMLNSDELVEVLLMYPFFRDFDRKRLPLFKRIIQFDTRVRSYEKGDIIIRRGDYGNSAFFILTGDVHVVTEWKEKNQISDTILGRRRQTQKSIWQSLSRYWTSTKLPEVRTYFKNQPSQSPTEQEPQGEVLTRIAKGETQGYFKNLQSLISRYESIRMEPGEMFGEMASLTRTTRYATVVSGSALELLEIRWQGLRDLRRLDPSFKQFIDSRYLERSLANLLSQNSLFKNCSKEDIQAISKHASFESYGYEHEDSEQSLQPEEVILQEGFYPNGLTVVLNGFVRISKSYGTGQRTYNYLRRGQCYGLEEINTNWKSKNNPIPYQFSLQAMGFVDLLTIPVALVEKYLLPHMTLEQLEQHTQSSQDQSKHAGHDTLEFLMDNRFINGTAAMVINMDRCTRCDDCVRACGDTHRHNPRFIRHGKKTDQFMVTNACMHCVDPVCMIDCPTGAIHRNADGGEVIINDKTCIGCASCANHCPYNNIRMVEVRDTDGALLVDETTNQPILKATKCDLCIDTMGGPACERACPHDALRRVDLQNISQLETWVKP